MWRWLAKKTRAMSSRCAVDLRPWTRRCSLRPRRGRRSGTAGTGIAAAGTGSPGVAHAADWSGAPAAAARSTGPAPPATRTRPRADGRQVPRRGCRSVPPAAAHGRERSPGRRGPGSCRCGRIPDPAQQLFLRAPRNRAARPGPSVRRPAAPAVAPRGNFLSLPRHARFILDAPRLVNPRRIAALDSPPPAGYSPDTRFLWPNCWSTTRRCEFDATAGDRRMKRRLEGLLQHALSKAQEGGALKSQSLPPLIFEIPKDPKFGDLATTVALALARAGTQRPTRHRGDDRRPPRGSRWPAGRHHDRGPRVHQLSAVAPILGALSRRNRRRHVRTLDLGHGRSVLVEFVSANPTGPLTVGHGRNAVLGDAVARLLEATGHRVTREYYFNNAGRQMTLLGESVRPRYLDLSAARSSSGGRLPGRVHCRHRARAPRRGGGEPQRGTGDRPLQSRRGARDSSPTSKRRCAAWHRVRQLLQRRHAVRRRARSSTVLDELRSRGLAFDRDGAVWLRGEPLGLDKDRVLVKSSGEPAYRLPDIAYHKDKLQRGFDLLIDVFGADHIAEHEDVRGGARGPGLRRDEASTAMIYQFVTLTRGGCR